MALRIVWLAFLMITLGLLPSTGRAADFLSTKPAARIDYWQQRQADITAELKERKDLPAVRLVFLGDSITDFWHLGPNPWFPTLRCGRTIWDESFAGQPPENLAINLGISGDRMEHVLFRLLPQSAGGLGHLDAPGLHPEFVVLMIGINNTWAGETPMVESVFAGIKAVLTAVHERQPKATVILQSLLPTNDEAKNRDVVRPVNQQLVGLVASQPFGAYTHFLDLYPSFVDATGQQLSQHFNDGLHPSESGYRVWRDRLVPFLAGVRAAARSAPVKP
ncbi:MAG: GDSL-type esterase/lipase family protein [Opitutae bacterium]